MHWRPISWRKKGFFWGLIIKVRSRKKWDTARSRIQGQKVSKYSNDQTNRVWTNFGIFKRSIVSLHSSSKQLFFSLWYFIPHVAFSCHFLSLYKSFYEISMNELPWGFLGLILFNQRYPCFTSWFTLETIWQRLV